MTSVRNLLYKDFRLANLVLSLLLMLLCVVMFIPAYPLYVGLLYICLAVFFAQMYFRDSNDIYFSMLLPIRKADIVLGHVAFYAILELLQLVVAVPVAVIRAAVNPVNPIGIDANPALFGFTLMLFGIFNLIFLGMHYKTAYNLGLPFAVAGGTVMVLVGVLEFAVQFVPVLKNNLDSVGGNVGAQIGVLVAGLVVFAALNLLTYRVAAARFQKVDL